MNEGELKKRIFEAQFLIHLIRTEDILKILDEAKKEYLEKCHPSIPCDCAECKWFKKWFGE